MKVEFSFTYLKCIQSNDKVNFFLKYAIKGNLFLKVQGSRGFYIKISENNKILKVKYFVVTFQAYSASEQSNIKFKCNRMRWSQFFGACSSKNFLVILSTWRSSNLPDLSCWDKIHVTRKKTSRHIEESIQCLALHERTHLGRNAFWSMAVRNT